MPIGPPDCSWGASAGPRQTGLCRSMPGHDPDRLLAIISKKDIARTPQVDHLYSERKLFLLL